MMKSNQTIRRSTRTLVFFLLAATTMVACQIDPLPSSPTPIVVPDKTITTSPGTPTLESTGVATNTPFIMVAESKTPQFTDTLPANLTTRQTMTLSPSPMSTATQLSTLSPPVSDTATATVSVFVDSVDRTCPEPPPEKPDYNHYYLSGMKWPVPAPNAGEHFWLSKPFSGGGRFLYTDWLPYGYDAGGRYLLHTGVDSAEPEGTPVLASAAGTVIVAGPDKEELYGWRCDWYGNLVVIQLDYLWLDQPVYVLYGHVLNISVELGQHVSLGEQIAEVGFGGAASLPHLHFEVRVGTNEFRATRNPLLWLEPPESRGVIAGRLIDPNGRPWQGVTVAAVSRSGDDKIYRTWTYLDDPQHLINPDELFAENFVVADVLPGEYELYVEIQDEIYRAPIVVEGGEIVEAEIITLPYKTPDSNMSESQSTEVTSE